MLFRAGAKAYIIKDYNPFDKESGVYSKTVYEYCLFSFRHEPGTGKGKINRPFDERHVFAINELLESPCNRGIKLRTESGFDIHYRYSVVLKSGESYSMPESIFTPGVTSPIYPSFTIYDIRILKRRFVS